MVSSVNTVLYERGVLTRGSLLGLRLAVEVGVWAPCERQKKRHRTVACKWARQGSNL